MSEKPKQLKQVLKDVAPDRADSIMDRYYRILESDKAADSLAHIDNMADEIIQAGSESVDADHETHRADLVDAFDMELDSVSDSLGLEIAQSEPLETTDPMVAWIERWPWVTDVSTNPEELAAVDRTFSAMKSICDCSGVVFNLETYAQMYLQTPDPFRIPCEQIDSALVTLSGKVQNSSILQSRLNEKQYTLLDCLCAYSSGDFEAAESYMGDILADLDAYEVVENFRQKIGIDGLDFEHCYVLIEVAKENNVTLKQAIRYVRAVKRNENWKSVSFTPEETVEYLSIAIICLKEGGKETQEHVKRTLYVHSEFSKLRKALEARQQRYTKAAEQAEKELVAYRTKHPDVRLDVTIAEYQRTIATAERDLVQVQCEMDVNNANRHLAISYLGRDGVKADAKSTQTTIEAIMACRNANDLAAVTTRYGLPQNEYLAGIQARETQITLATLDHDLAAELHEDSAARLAYSRLSSGAPLSPQTKVDLQPQFDHELDRLLIAEASLADALSREASYFDSLPTSIDGVPAAEREYVTGRLGSYTMLLQTYRSIEGRIIGAHSTYCEIYGDRGVCIDFENGRFVIPRGRTDLDPAKTWIARSVKPNADRAGDKIARVYKFLGVPSDSIQVQSLETLAVSHLQEELLGRETQPVVAGLGFMFDDVNRHYGRVGAIPGRFEDLAKNPKAYERMRIPATRLFKEGLAEFDGLLARITQARNEALSFKAWLQEMKADTSAFAVYPHLRNTRDQQLSNAIARVDELLTSDKSPISAAAMTGIREGKARFQEMFDEYAIRGFFEIAAFAVVFATAVTFGVVGGYLSAKLAGLLFSSESILATVGATVLTVGGASLGGVIGGRVGTAFNNEYGLSQRAYGREVPLDLTARGLGQDFLVTFGFCLMTVGVARGSYAGFGRMASAESVYLSRIGKWGIDRLKYLGYLGSPDKWFRGRLTGRTAARGLAREAGEEFGQEAVETGAETVNPWLGFIVAVANAGDGVNVNFTKIGLDAKKVGLQREGNVWAFTTKTADEFVANLEAYYGKRAIQDLSVIQNPDGSITFNVIGETMGETAVGITVHPSQKNVAPEVAIDRIAARIGLTVTPGQPIRVNSVEQAMALRAELDSARFGVVVTETGLKVEKGAYAVEVVVNPAVLAEMKEKATILSTAARNIMDFLEKVRKGIMPSINQANEVMGNVLVFMTTISGLSLIPGNAHAIDFSMPPEITSKGARLLEVFNKLADRTISIGEFAVVLVDFILIIGIPGAIAIYGGWKGVNSLWNIGVQKYYQKRFKPAESLEALVARLQGFTPRLAVLPPGAAGHTDAPVTTTNDMVNLGDTLQGHLDATSDIVEDQEKTLLELLADNDIQARRLVPQIKELQKLASDLERMINMRKFNDRKFRQWCKKFESIAGRLRTVRLKSNKKQIVLSVAAILFAIAMSGYFATRAAEHAATGGRGAAGNTPTITPPLAPLPLPGLAPAPGSMPLPSPAPAPGSAPAPNPTSPLTPAPAPGSAPAPGGQKYYDASGNEVDPETFYDDGSDLLK